jgi:hypothetical protein
LDIIKESADVKSPEKGTSPPRLPIRHSLTPYYVVSLLVAVVMTAASLAGLLYPSRIYPTRELVESYGATDVANLLVGLPLLLGSMWFTRRGKLIGLLLWPGVLLYVVYIYVAYAFSGPASWAFLPYLALVAMGTYALIGLVAGIEGGTVQQRLAGTVPEKLSAGVLVVFGAFVLLRAMGVIGGALLSGARVSAADLPALVSDVLVSPASIIGGVLLWRRKPLGYVGGVGLLFQSSMLFVGLIVFLLAQPLLIGTSFRWGDLIAVLAIGLVCSIPFVLFVRGVLSRRGAP